jgi:3-dehydroquinate dehydratase
MDDDEQWFITVQINPGNNRAYEHITIAIADAIVNIIPMILTPM